MQDREEPRAASGLALLARPDYRRLWMIGGLSNAMRWLELIATGLFVFDATGSAGLVAVVSAARAMPLLLFGPAAGAMAEAVNRRLLMLAGLGVTTLAACLVVLLAAAGGLMPWHLAAAGFASGMLAAGELSVRRRMVAESARGATMSQAIAFDSITNAATRMVGPVAGGAAYAATGILGAYLVSAVLNAAALLLAFRVRHEQERRTLRLGAILRTIAEGVVIARGIPAVRTILAVTVALNAFGFSYVALMAPIGRDVFGASAVGVGVLVAAEPFGAILGAMLLARRATPAGLGLFLAGAIGFLILLALMPHSPGFLVATALLVTSGLGTAAFGTLQSSLVLEHSPPDARSRLLGLVTMGIGTGPLGMILSGAVAAALGAPLAVTVLALVGLVVVLLASARR
ncbi:MAG: MFS transporter [Acetobacteraceae bacterium]|jgi:MFS family permease|nr:MFS transporter [Acetobacteraceae bacterium]